MPVSIIQALEHHPARVVIAGGGVGALEALLALRDIAPAHLDVELVSPNTTFSYAALAVAEPFGLAERRPIDIPALAADQGVRFHQDALHSVDAERREVWLRSGARLAYDALLVATGVRAEPLLPGAFTFGGPADVEAFRRLLGEIESGVVKRVTFTAVRGTRWPLPLYELALMTSAWASRRGIEVGLELVTYEERPLGLFGARVSDRVATLLEDSGIGLRVSTNAVAVGPLGLMAAPGGLFRADRVVTLPRLRVDHIPGLPQGRGGFIPTDEYCRVEGLDDVYAVGDATWYPVKQGGLAAQQADVAAFAIAHAAGAGVEAFPFSPVLRGILLTGDTPQYLRGERGSAAASSPLWSPVAKVAGRWLAPYVAARGSGLESHPLVDLPEPPAGDPEHEAALQLALDAADAAAGWGDMATALRWLDVAEGANVTLPAEYALKRDKWRSEGGGVAAA